MRSRARAASTALESCWIDDPAPGTWWVLVQNWSPDNGPALPGQLATLVTAVEAAGLAVHADAQPVPVAGGDKYKPSFARVDHCLRGDHCDLIPFLRFDADNGQHAGFHIQTRVLEFEPNGQGSRLGVERWIHIRHLALPGFTLLERQLHGCVLSNAYPRGIVFVHLRIYPDTIQITDAIKI